MNSGTNLCDLCATGGESDVLGQDEDKVINLILRIVALTLAVRLRHRLDPRYNQCIGRLKPAQPCQLTVLLHPPPLPQGKQ